VNSLFKGRNLINILLLSLGFMVLFFGMIIFMFIPLGKAYKEEYKLYTVEMRLLRDAQAHHDEVMETLKNLQAKNRAIITGYEKSFDPVAFDKLYSRFFSKLTLTQLKELEKNDIFQIYEVNASSHINSPVDFYEFLFAINKSDNIIKVEFPISFVAQDERIHASFRMKVYGANFADFVPPPESDINETFGE